MTKPHRGIFWYEFPGSDDTHKKLNFAEFRHGIHPYNDATVGLEGPELLRALSQLSSRNRENGSKRKKNNP
jgi:hypothetical protein